MDTSFWHETKTGGKQYPETYSRRLEKIPYCVTVTLALYEATGSSILCN